MKQIDSPRKTAFHDIAQWMFEQGINLSSSRRGDQWTVTARQLDCKEQRQLNKELGLHKVNYNPERMSRTGKRKTKNYDNI